MSGNERQLRFDPATVVRELHLYLAEEEPAGRSSRKLVVDWDESRVVGHEKEVKRKKGVYKRRDVNGVARSFAWVFVRYKCGSKVAVAKKVRRKVARGLHLLDQMRKQQQEGKGKKRKRKNKEVRGNPLIADTFGRGEDGRCVIVHLFEDGFSGRKWQPRINGNLPPERIRVFIKRACGQFVAYEQPELLRIVVEKWEPVSGRLGADGEDPLALFAEDHWSGNGEDFEDMVRLVKEDKSNLSTDQLRRLCGWARDFLQEAEDALSRRQQILAGVERLAK